MRTELADTFFTILTLLADAGVLLAVVLVLGRRVPWVRRIGDAAVEAVGPSARLTAWMVATVATLGSLYYSEVAHYTPCHLCWYQRLCMYPLALILLVGLVRRDHLVRSYAAPFVVVGAPISLYHWLVERVHFFEQTSSCSASAPCSVPWFQELGFVTLAFMALSGFLLVGTLLLTDRTFERRTPDGVRSDDPTDSTDPTDLDASPAAIAATEG